MLSPIHVQVFRMFRPASIRNPNSAIGNRLGRGHRRAVRVYRVFGIRIDACGIARRRSSGGAIRVRRPGIVATGLFSFGRGFLLALARARIMRGRFALGIMFLVHLICHSILLMRWSPRSTAATTAAARLFLCAISPEARGLARRAAPTLLRPQSPPRRARLRRWPLRWRV
jgi:hypothetical protein